MNANIERKHIRKSLLSLYFTERRFVHGSALKIGDIHRVKRLPQEESISRQVRHPMVMMERLDQVSCISAEKSS
jgi:hypothetical protein